MNYYLVDLNIDVTMYCHCLVYSYRYNSFIKLSYGTVEDVPYQGSDFIYKYLITEIDDNDLVMLKLSGIIEAVDERDISHECLCRLESSARTRVLL